MSVAGEAYRQRRDAGLCVYSINCQSKPTHGVFCKQHRDLRAVSAASSRRLDYARRKLRGQCVTRRCPNAARETSVICASCAARHARYVATPRGKARIHATFASRRKRLLAAGLCAGCGREDLHSSTLGIACLDRMRARRLRKRPQGTLPRACTTCRVVGHNATSCPDRFTAGLDITSFAAARSQGVWDGA